MNPPPHVLRRLRGVTARNFIRALERDGFMYRRRRALAASTDMKMVVASCCTTTPPVAPSQLVPCGACSGQHNGLKTISTACDYCYEPLREPSPVLTPYLTAI